MKKICFSILCFLLLLPLTAEEDFIEEIVTVASKIPTESKNVLATVDILDAAILNKQAPKDVLSILSNSLAIDTSSRSWSSCFVLSKGI